MMKTCLLLLLFQISFKVTESRRGFILRGVKAECVQKHNILIESFGCYIEQRGNRTYGSGNIMFLAPVQQLNTHVTVFGKPVNGRRSKIIDMRIDLCHVFSGLKTERLFQLGTSYLKRFMNEVPYCPLKSHFNYTLSKGYFDEEDIPAYTPRGQFEFHLGFYKQKDEVATFNYYGKVIDA